MEFKEWLEEYNKVISERFKGPVPGAFGKRQNTSNKFDNINSRIATGRQIESKILDALRENLGWQIVPASVSEDKFDKIDGWIVEAGQKTPLQIKYRDKSSGSDIFMEVIKDYLHKTPGRDMVGKAKIYVTLSNDGKLLMIRQADEAKKIANEMAEEFDKKLLINPNLTKLQTRYGTIMISPDPATGVKKLKAYIDPNAFSWKKNITLDRSLH